MFRLLRSCSSLRIRIYAISCCQNSHLFAVAATFHHQQQLASSRPDRIHCNSPYQLSISAKNPFFLNRRGFCCAAGSDVDAEAGEQSDDEIVEGFRREDSGADPEEVNKVCKVIDELFAIDRNMEAVLDDCNFTLSTGLVVAVLERFKHARKPAYRFFCWAGGRPDYAHDSTAYNAMMSIFGKTRQFETMVPLLHEMGEKGLLTIETFSIAIKAFAAAKERKKAVGMFDLMRKYKFEVGVETVNVLLDNLGRAKLGKEANALFEKLKDSFTPDMRTYTALLCGWCKIKNLLEAGRVWNEMVDKGFKPDLVAHHTMLEGLLRGKKRSDAVKLFRVMKVQGPAPNVRTYTLLIRDMCKHMKMEEAVELYDEMLESGIEPDAAIFTCLMTGYGNQRKMDKVYGVLQEMKEKGCPPDGHTYNALIKLMTNRRMAEDALRLYQKMVKSDIQPTIHTFNMLIKCFFICGNYDICFELWDEMKYKGCCPDDNTYTLLVSGLIRQGKSDEACKYIEEMLGKGMKAPQLDLNKFASDISRGGKPNALQEMARKMKLAGKLEMCDFFTRCAEMTRRRVKGRSFQ
uniref:Pentatricopeptide repeat-containing protein n=1 Tax=Kalanchoe fedtschenkoi TaxID=63787 RepID=A0A7N0VHD7_KALFE